MCCPSITSWAGCHSVDQCLPLFLHHSLLKSKLTSNTDTQIATDNKEEGVHCSCLMCICGNLGDHSHVLYLCNNVAPIRKRHRKLAMLSENNVSRIRKKGLQGDVQCRQHLDMWRWMFFQGNKYVSRFSLHVIDTSTLFQFFTIPAVP